MVVSKDYYEKMQHIINNIDGYCYTSDFRSVSPNHPLKGFTVFTRVGEIYIPDGAEFEHSTGHVTIKWDGFTLYIYATGEGCSMDLVTEYFALEDI